MRKTVFVLLVSCIVLVSIAFGNELISSSPANAEVYFVEPNNGQVVSRTFKIKFGLKAMEVEPAGVNRENTGHHHLLIDLEELPDLTKPLPSTDNIKHFGGGQTETELTLSPGKHTLQLILGNFAHIPHNKPVLSEKIIVIVK